MMNECGNVTDGGEAQPGYDRIRRLIRKFVEGALPERSAGGQQSDGASFGILPTGRSDGEGRILITHAHGEVCLRLVQSGRRISKSSLHR